MLVRDVIIDKDMRTLPCSKEAQTHFAVCVQVGIEIDPTTACSFELYHRWLIGEISVAEEIKFEDPVGVWCTFRPDDHGLLYIRS